MKNKIVMLGAFVLAAANIAQPAAAAIIDRVSAIHIAENYVSGGTVKDRYGRDLEIAYVNFQSCESVGDTYLVGLVTGRDMTDMGGYLVTCTGSVQVSATNGNVLANDFTCVETD